LRAVCVADAIVVIAHAPCQSGVALRLDLYVNQYLPLALAQAQLDQLVGHHAVGRAAEAAPR